MPRVKTAVTRGVVHRKITVNRIGNNRHVLLPENSQTPLLDPPRLLLHSQPTLPNIGTRPESALPHFPPPQGIPHLSPPLLPLGFTLITLFSVVPSPHRFFFRFLGGNQTFSARGQ